MRTYDLQIFGVKLIEPDIFYDNRGYFSVVFKHSDFLDDCIDINMQENQSLSLKKGTIRGLHFQKYPYQQAKLVRVLRGSIIDVVVDLRPNKDTFLKHLSVKLDDKENKQLLIPNYMAHAFITLEDNTIVNYKVDNYFSKEADSGIRYDDHEICIDWEGFVGNTEFTISEKDKQLQYVNNKKEFFE